MFTIHRKQLERMNEHFNTCKYEGAGSFSYSFRLEQGVRSKELLVITQIKCCGCGYSLDYVPLNQQHCEYPYPSCD